VEINETGDGLGIIINCYPHTSDNWSAFACWYSFHKNLPDAKLVLAYNRMHAEWDMFKWAHPCGVDIITYSSKDPNAVFSNTKVFDSKKVDLVKIISPQTMALRTYHPDIPGPVDVQSNEPATLVTYEHRCGGFILSEWINRVEHPFHNAIGRFGNVDPTLNEMKVLELWEKAGQLFTF